MMPYESSQSYRILLIDDNLAIYNDFRNILMGKRSSGKDLHEMEPTLFGIENQEIASTSFEIDCASQGEEGLAMAKKALAQGRPYAVAFVDGRMPPGWDGIETIGRLWQECSEMQVVFCTAYADYSWYDIRRVLGETDSLVILKKPFDNMEVLQLAHTLTRKWELKRQVHQLAYYDNLTGLPNRILFIDMLSRNLEITRRYQRKGALLFIDLDNFKRINDTLGHSVGDDLLKATAVRLKNCLRASDTISRSVTSSMAARLGGDEFTVLLAELNKDEVAAVIARRISDQLAKPMDLGNHQVIVTPSIGIVLFPQDGDNVETLLKNADLAMYFAKRTGPNTFKYFQKSMNSAALKRLTIENHLRQAFERDEFALHYQPQFNLSTCRLSGLEALLRWNNWELGNIPPNEFIPIAEESGLIIAIGEWVLRTACCQAKAWLDQGLTLPRVGVNVSLRQFIQPNFLEMVRNVLVETGLEPSVLQIEITESMLLKDPEVIAATLRALSELNVQLAIDDFGTGYSSLSRLKELPIDCLKIDRSFVCGIGAGMRDQSILSAVIAMAAGMDLRLIAEGVETSNQIDFLRSRQCHEAQGFFLSRPLPQDQAESFLKQTGLTKP